MSSTSRPATRRGYVRDFPAGSGRYVVDARGYHSVIVIPNTQSQEKKDTLRQLGAELIEVPAVPYKDPNNYVKWSGRLAEELPQAVGGHGPVAGALAGEILLLKHFALADGRGGDDAAACHQPGILFLGSAAFAAVAIPSISDAHRSRWRRLSARRRCRP